MGSEMCIRDSNMALLAKLPVPIWLYWPRCECECQDASVNLALLAKLPVPIWLYWPRCECQFGYTGQDTSAKLATGQDTSANLAILTKLPVPIWLYWPRCECQFGYTGQDVPVQSLLLAKLLLYCSIKLATGQTASAMLRPRILDSRRGKRIWYSFSVSPSAHHT